MYRKLIAVVLSATLIWSGLVTGAAAAVVRTHDAVSLQAHEQRIMGRLHWKRTLQGSAVAELSPWFPPDAVLEPGCGKPAVPKRAAHGEGLA